VWPSVAACDVESTLQRWTLNHRGGGVFEIVSDGGGRCLEIGGASTEEGAALRHADCTGLSNQRFLTNSFLPPGWHEIAPLSSQIRQCANARHGDQEQGAPVTQWTCSGLENQQFALTPLKPDTRDHAICAEHSGQCLVPVAVPAGTVAPLFPVVQKVLIDAPAYRWRAHFTGRGFRLRSSPIPTVCLSVDPAAIWSNGATIGYAPCDEVDHQRFSIR
jgi:hypothetical protein